MTLTLSVDAAGSTDRGLVRRRNEDAVYVGRDLFVVADGLGGHPAGDAASAAVIEALRAYDRPVASTDLLATAGAAVNAANESLRRCVAAAPRFAGMASTLVALLRAESTVAVANVGDSRAYLLRDGETRQLTEDHTYEHLVAGAGAVPDLPARLSRFLDGRTDGRSPDLTTVQVRPGDRFLLCSDGLSSYVPHEAIHATLNCRSDLAGGVVDRLVALALDHGGLDNVAVVVVDVRVDR